MTRFLRLIYVLTGFMLLSTSALADTPFPTINEPTDESVKCIQPEDVMRREHMEYILHERDETMHEGIRGEPKSLANCINCHVEPDENGQIAGIESDQHFCNACHEYAAVQIDCFQCHADRPQKYIKRTEHSSSIQQQLHKTLAAHDNASEGVTK